MNRREFLKHAAAANMALVVAPLLGSASLASPRQTKPQVFEGRRVFDRLVRTARHHRWADRPIGALVGAIGMELRGTPYVASTLELYVDREVCTANLLGLDCVTFFETALDFARMLKKGGSSPEAMLEQLTYTRYRDGAVSDYTSRLHYTSDWFHDNEEKHVVHEITRELPGAERFTAEVNFMSTHRDAYPQLKAHPKLVAGIAEAERRINSRTMYFVPKERVEGVESSLQTGDIVGITTALPGLDCSHTGLCSRDGQNVLRYLHASSSRHQVVLEGELSSYLKSVTKHTGIMVARPLELS